MKHNFTSLVSGVQFAEFMCADTGNRVSVELKPNEGLQQDPINGGFRVVSLRELRNPQTYYLKGVITKYTIDDGHGAEVYNLVGDHWEKENNQ